MKVNVELDIPNNCSECPLCHTFIHKEEYNNISWNSAVCAHPKYHDEIKGCGVDYDQICKNRAEKCPFDNTYKEK